METTGNNFIEVKEMAENYIIEGTVSEISSEKPEEVNFKIFGTEGYALKIGKNKYNILCSETILKNAADDSTTKDESKIYSETFILSQQILFTSTDTAKVGIIRYNSLGKHIKAKISSETEISTLLDAGQPLPISSVIILAD